MKTPLYLKVYNIKKLFDSIFVINSLYTAQIAEPIDKEAVNKYYPLYYGIKDLNCLFRFNRTNCTIYKLGVSILVKREDEIYTLRISKHSIRGDGKWVTDIERLETDYEGAVSKIRSLY